jgi:hypothetical protein
MIAFSCCPSRICHPGRLGAELWRKSASRDWDWWEMAIEKVDFDVSPTLNRGSQTIFPMSAHTKAVR